MDTLVRLARGDGGVRPDQLTHPYSAAELEQVLSVLRKLLRAQQVVLANNQAYIASAAQMDSSRTEPPFLRGRLSEEQARRWAEVKAAYVRAQALGGEEDDPMSRAVGAVGLLADRVGAVEAAITEAATRLRS